jgi:hypothetical protein
MKDTATFEKMYAYLFLCVCVTQLNALTPREIVMNKLIQDISEEQVRDLKSAESQSRVS